MTSAFDFTVFCAAAFIAAAASVQARKTLYAVLWQVQAVAAISGLMVCMNARFIAFALLSTAASTFLVFLMFALIVFDPVPKENVSAKKNGLFFFLMVVLPACGLFWLFSRLPEPDGTETGTADFSFAALGMLLYSRYAVCLMTAGFVLAAAAIGVTTSMMSGNQENRPDLAPQEPQKSKTELRRVPVERRTP